MEELTIDNTPVTNEKDQEAVIEAVLFTMGSAVELKQLATAIGQDKETAKAAVERLMKRYQTGKHGMEISLGKSVKKMQKISFPIFLTWTIKKWTVIL